MKKKPQSLIPYCSKCIQNYYSSLMRHLKSGGPGASEDFPCIYLMTSVTQGTMLSHYILEKILVGLIKTINTLLHINILYFTRTVVPSCFHIISGSKSKQRTVNILHCSFNHLFKRMTWELCSGKKCSTFITFICFCSKVQP